MKNIVNMLAVSFFTVCLTILPGCQKESEVPTLATTPASAITETSAMVGGTVTSKGSSEVTARGVCWSTTPNPSVADNITIDGAGSGSFSSTMTGLTLNMKYYVRAYATNSEGTGYGNEISVTMRLPATLTASIESFSSTTAVTIGNITDDGGSAVSERGVCWSTLQNPTTVDNHAISDIIAMTFTSNISELNPGTTYFVRTYAVNMAGTAYSDQVSFTTDAEVDPIVFRSDLTYGSVSDIDGNIYKTIQIGNLTWMAENLKTTRFNDGVAIPQITLSSVWSTLETPGYCWYNNNEVTNKDVYGALYNRVTVNNGNLCPVGWHVPNREEFNDLIENVAQGSDVGTKLKESGNDHWSYPNAEADNSSGWTALPGGFRSVEGNFEQSLGLYGYWWLKDEQGATEGQYASLYYNSFFIDILSTYESWPNGLSVRCVKDN